MSVCALEPVAWCSTFRRDHEVSFRAGGELNPRIGRFFVDAFVRRSWTAHLPADQAAAGPLNLRHGAVQLLLLSPRCCRTFPPGGQRLHGGREHLERRISLRQFRDRAGLFGTAEVAQVVQGDLLRLPVAECGDGQRHGAGFLEQPQRIQARAANRRVAVGGQLQQRLDRAPLLQFSGRARGGAADLGILIRKQPRERLPSLRRPQLAQSPKTESDSVRVSNGRRV